MNPFELFKNMNQIKSQAEAMKAKIATIRCTGYAGGNMVEAVANGIEDYEYLTIAERLFGKSYVDKTIAKVTKDLTHYTLSDGVFAKVRTELGAAIEKAAR